MKALLTLSLLAGLSARPWPTALRRAWMKCSSAAK